MSAVFSLAVDPWNSVRVPEVGEYRMLVLSPTVVELSLITTRGRGDSDSEWDFANGGGELFLPDAAKVGIQVAGNSARRIGVRELGFKRRALYAPLGVWDLRIGAHVYLQLEDALTPGDALRLEDRSGKLSLEGRLSFTATFAPQNFSPVFHTNQVGYAIGGTKTAKVGYYLGSLGELDLSSFQEFYVRNTQTGELVLQAPIVTVKETGFGDAYQKVLHLDFTSVDQKGIYALGIIGLGESYPFWISDDYWANLTRAYALGTYHQRCGCALERPFSRFTHEPCHVHEAEIPTMDASFDKAQGLIRDITDEDNPEQTAPEMVSVESSLYPILKEGSIDVSGGHHDAGDYSKYTVNSAHFVNTLMTAVDSFPDVAKIDNLGLPESGDGVSDLLQIAKYEGDFLAKLQDDDGGFFFLVYPKERAYESDVAPDKGDPQIVFPKNTISTAAATAALAQMASSRKFKFQYPMEAARMLEQAKKGWEFLEKAWAEHGETGAYQTISHYGDVFMDRDEIIWAATELYLATGEKKYHEFMLSHFDPQDKKTMRWGWLRLYEAYGAAVRSYAFAETSGRMTGDKLDRAHLRACIKELLARSEDMANWTGESSYGLAFPEASKAIKQIGWFFPASECFDMVAMSVAGRMNKYDAAVTSNINYELGVNPRNVCFLTGLGWKRQFEIVHQWTHNDDFALPITGIPIGVLQDGPPWIPPYEAEIGKLTFPSDGGGELPHAFYDRWTDTFNTSTEFVNVQQARSLVTCAYYMAKTAAAEKEWKSGKLEVSGLPEFVKTGEAVRLTAVSSDPSMKIEDAFVVWETRAQQPLIGPSVNITPQTSGVQWVSVEAQWPDGRRTYFDGSFTVTRADGGQAIPADPWTTFLISADTPELKKGKDKQLENAGELLPGMPFEAIVSVKGAPQYSASNLGWMAEPAGAALVLNDFADSINVKWNSPAQPAKLLEISGWFYFEKFPYAVETAEILSYGIGESTPLVGIHFDKWEENGYPRIQLGHDVIIDAKEMAQFVKLGEWQFLMLRLSVGTWQLLVDNKEVASGQTPEGRTMNFTDDPRRDLNVGGFKGAFDELRVRELP
jgi:hypothetical protein